MTDKEIFDGIQAIYDNEVNIKITTLWDGGYDVSYDGNDHEIYHAMWKVTYTGYKTLREAMIALIKIHSNENKKRIK